MVFFIFVTAVEKVENKVVCRSIIICSLQLKKDVNKYHYFSLQ